MSQQLHSSPDQPFLTVVIPTYNEIDNFKRPILREVVAYLQNKNFKWELILSDDGSNDGTLKKLKQFAEKHHNVRVLANPHRGKGPTVKEGMLAASGKWRLFTDFDQSTPIQEIEKLLVFKENYEIIIGSREIEGALRGEEPIHRHLMGKVFNIIVQALAVPGIWDTQCGFKLFSDEATKTLFPRLYIYGQEQERKDAFTGAFDVELLYLARKYDFKIKEVPILWQHYETDRVDPLKDSWRMFKDIVRIRLAGAGGKYPAL